MPGPATQSEHLEYFTQGVVQIRWTDISTEGAETISNLAGLRFLPVKDNKLSQNCLKLFFVPLCLVLFLQVSFLGFSLYYNIACLPKEYQQRGGIVYVILF